MPPVSIRPSMLEQRCKEFGGKTCVTVLVACGECLRRVESPESAPPIEIERALAALSVQEVEAALAGADLVTTRRDLTRAGSEAFEAAFADSDEERSLFQKSAFEALFSRDRLASMLAAAEAKGAAAGADGAPLAAAVAALRGRVGEVDQAVRGAVVRSLTALNGERRAALARLTEAARREAWWYGERAGEADDDLLAALGALEPGAGAAAHDDELRRAALPSAARLEASALRHVSLGRDGGAERAFLDARARGSQTTKSALELASADLEEPS